MESTREPGIEQRVPAEHVETSSLIQVAVDGSAGSRRALEWALHEAAVRHCGVELVTAYQPEPDESADDARRQAERTLHSTMDKIVTGRDAQVSWQVVRGDPIDVLVRCSTQSAMLVMGSHSVDGLRHSALGSVADSCARMADCPVVIVPPTRRQAAGYDQLVSLPTASLVSGTSTVPVN